MHQLYVLYEAATGFSVFRITEFEEIGVFIPQVREGILNISKFRSNVFFVAYQPFTDKKNALDNLNSCFAGELSQDLQLFLENNIPRSKKSKQPVVLGVIDPSLAAAISDKLGIKCISTGVVMEITRGIRVHFQKLVKGFGNENLIHKSQLALGNSFARNKVNINAKRLDSMIIESNNLVDDFDKGINKLGRGVRTRYSIHFPELYKIIPDNVELYVQCVEIIGDRNNMPENVKENLCAMLGESDTEAILSAAKSSMGAAISPVDMENIKNLCERVMSLIKRQQATKDYLKNKMKSTAPNMSALVGEMIGSRLITRAGGLEKLAKLPASTVQVLGAGKNYFRTLSGHKGKVPISGLISDSSAVRKSVKRKKGHMARILANKCALAARVDCFSKVIKEEFGGQLIEEVKKCVKYSKKSRLENKNQN